MASSEGSAWDGWCKSQLRIVLLGGRNSGKSSLGNLILGREEFSTGERTSCCRRLRAVSGRRLTVVDTPGWWCDFSSQDNPRLVRRELLSGVSLCSPGPHVFLLAVKASSAFSERRRRAVEEHVALLGERAWSHCVLVLTSADRSERARAEEEEEEGRAGSALRWLRDKCNRRCHRVVWSDEPEAAGPRLLLEVQKVVEENGNRVFEMQGGVLQANEDDKRRREEAARLRFMEVKQRRAIMRERLRPLTDIRIVLLGARGSGKTSVLNTILGRESSQRRGRTARCLVGGGVVLGRRVTAVDTPGWWMNYLCDDTPLFDLREILLSLSLCPPGPHVFLLVVRVDRAFTETYRRAVQEHVEMIGQRTWGGVLLLFSFGDWLGDTTIEQFIESEGEPLRWLVERCGNRYHVLNNKTKGDPFQVRELIAKIEEMAAASDGGRHYHIERSVMEQLEGKMRREEERAKERLMEKEKQRQMARSQLEKVDPFPELRIVLVGGRKTGKSSCGNTILSRKCFSAGKPTASCAKGWARVSGKAVTVLDTPACFSVTPDLLEGPSLCSVALVVNASASFRDGQAEALEKQLEVAGGPAWSRALVLFSNGDWLGDAGIERRLEAEGEPLRRLVQRCGNRYHVLDNKRRGEGAQVDKLIELIEEMLVGEMPAGVHGDDHAGGRVPAPEQQEQSVTLCKKDLKVLMSNRQQTHCDLTESATSTSCLPLNSEDAGEGGEIVVLPGGRPGPGSPVSCLAALLSAKDTPSWTTAGLQKAMGNVPAWFPGGQASPFPLRRPTVVLILPQAQQETSAGENIVNVSPLRHPSPGEKTLRRPMDCGGLRVPIDPWGGGSLAELEAFIDSYFESMWEQSLGSLQPPERRRPTEQEAEEEALSSINRRLSKLDLLEEIRRDLAELRRSLEHSWEANRKSDRNVVHEDPGE